MPETPLKRKWAAGVLSACFPGLGHMYAGAMQRGLFFMLLIICNIAGVVLVSIEGIVPLIVLLAMLIPVGYFYAFFDALKTTERVNAGDRFPAGSPEEEQGQTRGVIGAREAGFALVVVGLCFYWIWNEPDWLDRLMSGNITLYASIVLIGAGILIFFSRRNGK